VRGGIERGVAVKRVGWVRLNHIEPGMGVWEEELNGEWR